MSLYSFMQIFIFISSLFVVVLVVRYYNRRKKQKEFLIRKLKKLMKLKKTIENCRKIISRNPKSNHRKKAICKRKEEQIKKILLKRNQ